MTLERYQRVRRYCWPVARWLGCFAASGAFFLGILPMTVLAIRGPSSSGIFSNTTEIGWWSVAEPVRSTDFVFTYLLHAMIVATGAAFLMSRWRATRALFVLGFTAVYLFAWHFRVQSDVFAALNLGVWLNTGDVFAITFLWVTWSEMTCRIRGIVDPAIPPLVKPRPHVAGVA